MSTFEAIAEFPETQAANGYAETPTKSRRFRSYQEAYDFAALAISGAWAKAERVGVFCGDSNRWTWIKD